MARSTPVHSGYTIVNGAGTGPNGGRIDVWVEYKIGAYSIADNTTPFTAYFYAALNPSYSSSTSATSGLKSSFTVNGTAGTAVSNGSYDFRSANTVNLLGKYSGNISHASDGTKTIKISGSFTTSSSWITGGSVSAFTVTLPTIPRASTITSAGNVTLGKACSVKWTPLAASFRYKLKFSVGTWSYTTGAIHPNKTTAYTYSDYTIPLSVANQIKSNSSGTVAVVLYTYSDSNCSNQIGSDDATFTATVPDNSNTKPIVTMVLSPEASPLEGLYIQGKTKVKATLSAEGQLGASVSSYSLLVDGTSYGSPYVSNYLNKPGDFVVTGKAKDTRGYTGTQEATITVQPYSKPKLLSADGDGTVIAARCTSEGLLADNGEYLKIKAMRIYSPVIVDDVQYNFCQIRYRYKTEQAQDYSEWATILAEDAPEDSVITDPLLNATFDKALTYTVQVSAVDTVGEETVTSVTIASENVYMHKKAGGKGMGLGGYCEEDDLLDVHWNQRVRKTFTCDEDVNGLSFNGVRMKRLYVSSTSSFYIKTEFDEWVTSDSSQYNYNRQAIFMFGMDNWNPVYGIITVANGGRLLWTGNSEDVTLSKEDGGYVKVTLSATCFDYLAFLSAEDFEVSTSLPTA